MKKTIAVAGVTLALLFGGATTANAATPTETCVTKPVLVSEASTTLVEHPAVTQVEVEGAHTDVVWSQEPVEGYTATGEERWVVTVEAVPAVPPTDAVYGPPPLITPAQPEVLEQSHWKYQWKWWGNAQHGNTIWTDGSYPTHKGWGHGEWRKNGNKEKVVTQEYVPAKPAVYGEPPLISEATPGTPAVEEQGYTEYEYSLTTTEWIVEGGTFSEGFTATGETRTVIVTPAWTETVVVDAVYEDREFCEPVPVVSEERPVVTPESVAEVEAPVAAKVDALPVTGGSGNLWLAGFAGLLLVVGAGAVWFGRGAVSNG